MTVRDDSIQEQAPLASAERLKAFTDAVVAIAMTLLILPLLESIGEAVEREIDTAQWVNDNSGRLFAFAISFVIIAMFWVNHHRLFARVERVSSALLWITIAWMLTIVWLPVATALTGQMDTDPLQIVLYIGTMAVTSLLLLAARLYLRAHPELHNITPAQLSRGAVADATMAGMFLVCLVVAITVPWLGYFALFLMTLVGPLHGLITRIARQR